MEIHHGQVGLAVTEVQYLVDLVSEALHLRLLRLHALLLHPDLRVQVCQFALQTRNLLKARRRETFSFPRPDHPVPRAVHLVKNTVSVVRTSPYRVAVRDVFLLNVIQVCVGVFEAGLSALSLSHQSFRFSFIKSCRECRDTGSQSWSLRAFSRSISFSSQHRALVRRELEPPEITPALVNSVPSSATVYRAHIGLATLQAGSEFGAAGGNRVAADELHHLPELSGAAGVVDLHDVDHHLGAGHLPQPLVQGTHLGTRKPSKEIMTYIQVVDGQEGLALGSLFLDERDAVTSHLLCGHHDGVHEAAKHLDDSQLVLLMDGAAQVGQATKLGQKNMKKRFQSHFHGETIAQPVQQLVASLLASALLAVQVGVAQLLHHLAQLLLQLLAALAASLQLRAEALLQPTVLFEGRPETAPLLCSAYQVLQLSLVAPDGDLQQTTFKEKLKRRDQLLALPQGIADLPRLLRVMGGIHFGLDVLGSTLGQDVLLGTGCSQLLLPQDVAQNVDALFVPEELIQAQLQAVLVKVVHQRLVLLGLSYGLHCPLVGDMSAIDAILGGVSYKTQEREL
ncbi:hypothetical protein EYF80_012529 [Liparis tanakae]|uniref:Uncharacterized protein n=1 Tax=Liparis tanakae TaxID=230148 RepID=A0A4Z2IIX5_9TELE|nr:hypothetical protein EYF80_012529 [Liparis tanakae]